jgi:hypothetical protein
VRGERCERGAGGARPSAVISAWVATAVLAGGLYVSFAMIDAWAGFVFARPMLASALVAAVDVALFAVAAAAAPLLSRLLEIALLRRR